MKIAIDLMGGEDSGTPDLAACNDYPFPSEYALFGDVSKLDHELIRQVL
jgi:hypothetical protein